MTKYYPTLLAHYYLALPGQRDHTIFMFRQSTHTPSEVFLPKNGGKYIAKSRKFVAHLRQTREINVEAMKNSKGRFLPFFVASEKLEVEYPTKSFDDEGYSVE